jgi:hypothetical protein
MPLRNVILVAYKTGHVEVSDAVSIAANGRRETYLELGTVEDRDLAIDVATAVLEVQSQRRASVVVDPLPRYAPDGFIDFQLGDTLSTFGDQRVVGLTISQDDEGRASVIPELKDRVSVREEEVNRWLRRLSDGAMGGATEQASRTYPAPVPVLRGRVLELPPFSYDGVLAPGIISEPYSPTVPQQIVHIVVNLRVAGSTNTGIRVVDEVGNVRCSVTVPSGRKLWAEDVSPPEYISPGRQILVDVPTAGTDAAGLTVQLRVTTT